MKTITFILIGIFLMSIISSCGNKNFPQVNVGHSVAIVTVQSPPINEPVPSFKPGIHVAVNPEIMSEEKRSLLTPEQQELVSLLDDYEFYFNKHVNPENKYNIVEGQAPFGQGYITIKVLNLLNTNSLEKVTTTDIRACVVIKNKIGDSDSKSILKGDYSFVFGKDTKGVWALYYWWQ